MYNINSFKFVENNLTLYIDGISAVGPFSEWGNFLPYMIFLAPQFGR